MKSNKKQLPGGFTLLSLIALSLVIWLSCVMIQPGAFFTSLRTIFQLPSLVLLNYLPVLIVLSILYLLIGNVFTGAAIASLVFNGLSYANLLKMDGRNDPLVPSDLTMIRESLDAVSDYQLNLHPFSLAVLIGVFAVCFALSRFLCTPRPRWLIRLPVIATLTAALIGMIFTVYADKDYYSNLPNINIANVPAVFNTYGFNYCFLHNATLYAVDKPENYSASEVKKWEQQTLPADTPQDVNVICIMGESFSKLSDESAFTYASDEDNPLYFYHQLENSEQSISGNIIVSGFGAGTANTEFDVITGMQTTLLDATNPATSAFRTVHHNIPTLASVFSDAGAQTWFLHPGKSWFYNRESVYRYFGIQDSTFEEVFDGMPLAGSFYTDEAFLSVMNDGISRLEQNGNYFIFSVTIENHQAYTASKYGDSLTEQIPFHGTLSASSKEQLSVYLQGVRHTSEMLEQLTQELNQSDKPTLLLFFGDHRPALGADYAAYREIGSDCGKTDTPEHILYAHEVPYLIWGNTAYQDKYPFDENSLDLPQNGLLNSNYLGALVYEITGMTGQDAYFDFLTQARRTLPVFYQNSYCLPDGQYTDTLTQEQSNILHKLHCWQYYRLKTAY